MTIVQSLLSLNQHHWASADSLVPRPHPAFNIEELDVVLGVRLSCWHNCTYIHCMFMIIQCILTYHCPGWNFKLVFFTARVYPFTEGDSCWISITSTSDTTWTLSTIHTLAVKLCMCVFNWRIYITPGAGLSSLHVSTSITGHSIRYEPPFNDQ